MKLIYSLPSNKALYSKFAPVVLWAFKHRHWLQIISGLTVAAMVYYLTSDFFNYFFSENLGTLLPYLFAGISALTIEKLTHKFLPLSMRSKLFFWNAPTKEKAITGFVHLIAFGALTISLLLSYFGSIELARNNSPAPIVIGTDSVRKENTLLNTQIQNSYAKDSLQVATENILSVQAIESRYNALIAVEQNKIDNYKARQRREEKSYFSAIERKKSKNKNPGSRKKRTKLLQ